jgi:hypothetical protein
MKEAYLLTRAQIAWADRQEHYIKDPSYLKEQIVKQKGRCAISGAPMMFARKYCDPKDTSRCHPLYAEIDIIKQSTTHYDYQIVCSELKLIKDKIPALYFGENPYTPVWKELMCEWKSQAEDDPTNIAALKALVSAESLIKRAKWKSQTPTELEERMLTKALAKYGSLERISTIDRIHALKNSQMYRKDFKRYLKEYKNEGNSDYNIVGIMPDYPKTKRKEAIFILSDPAEKLCRKYELRYPIDPNARYNDKELRCLRRPVDYFIRKELMGRIKRNPKLAPAAKDIEKELVAYIGGRLLLFVNTYFFRDQIDYELNDILDEWTTMPNKRFREHEVGIWKVYKLHTKGIKPPDIAEKMLGKGKNPKYDEKAEGNCKKIERAIDKADRIVQQIEARAKSLHQNE